MTREEAKRLWPIIRAYSEGKTIEYLIGEDKWVELGDPVFSYDASLYRVKPEPRYRPFQNSEECWEEMVKHEPFGWIKNEVEIYSLICGTRKDAILFSLNPIDALDFKNAFSRYMFADGTPFGVRED